MKSIAILGAMFYLIGCNAEILKLVCQVSGTVVVSNYEEKIPLTPVLVEVEYDNKFTLINVTGSSALSMIASNGGLMNFTNENEFNVFDFVELKSPLTTDSKNIRINRITGTIEASSIKEVVFPNGKKEVRLVDFNGHCSKAPARRF